MDGIRNVQHERLGRSLTASTSMSNRSSHVMTSHDSSSYNYHETMTKNLSKTRAVSMDRQKGRNGSNRYIDDYDVDTSNNETRRRSSYSRVAIDPKQQQQQQQHAPTPSSSPPQKTATTAATTTTSTTTTTKNNNTTTMRQPQRQSQTSKPKPQQQITPKNIESVESASFVKSSSSPMRINPHTSSASNHQAQSRNMERVFPPSQSSTSPNRTNAQGSSPSNHEAQQRNMERGNVFPRSQSSTSPMRATANTSFTGNRQQQQQQRNMEGGNVVPLSQSTTSPMRTNTHTSFAGNHQPQQRNMESGNVLSRNQASNRPFNHTSSAAVSGSSSSEKKNHVDLNIQKQPQQQAPRRNDESAASHNNSKNKSSHQTERIRRTNRLMNGKKPAFIKLLKASKFKQIIDILTDRQYDQMEVVEWMNENTTNKNDVNLLDEILPYQPTLELVELFIGNGKFRVTVPGIIPEEVINQYGQVPLHIAAGNGCEVSIIHRLLRSSSSHHTPAMCRDNRQRFPLHLACCNVKGTRNYTNNNISINCDDNNNPNSATNVLNSTTNNNSSTGVAIISSIGSTLGLSSKSKNKIDNMTKIIEVLIGAYPEAVTARDKDGYRPIDLARQNKGDQAIISLLSEQARKVRRSEHYSHAQMNNTSIPNLNLMITINHNSNNQQVDNAEQGVNDISDRMYEPNIEAKTSTQWMLKPSTNLGCNWLLETALLKSDIPTEIIVHTRIHDDEDDNSSVSSLESNGNHGTHHGNAHVSKRGERSSFHATPVTGFESRTNHSRTSEQQPQQQQPMKSTDQNSVNTPNGRRHSDNNYISSHHNIFFSTEGSVTTAGMNSDSVGGDSKSYYRHLSKQRQCGNGGSSSVESSSVVTKYSDSYYGGAGGDQDSNRGYYHRTIPSHHELLREQQEKQHQIIRQQVLLDQSRCEEQLQVI